MLEIPVKFHTPFRVSTGTGDQKADVVVLADRIPASSLKGVMRAAAQIRLELPELVVLRLFGSAERDCPWGWTDLRLDEAATIRVRVQVPIDRRTGTARRGALLKAEEIWVNRDQQFAVERTSTRDETTDKDAVLLAACALAVQSLGASRRRGLGWVSMTPRLAGDPVTPEAAPAAVVEARKQAKT